jgi:hypothetical protein
MLLLNKIDDFPVKEILERLNNDLNLRKKLKIDI